MLLPKLLLSWRERRSRKGLDVDDDGINVAKTRTGGSDDGDCDDKGEGLLLLLLAAAAVPNPRRERIRRAIVPEAAFSEQSRTRAESCRAVPGLFSC